jgi:Sulfatase
LTNTIDSSRNVAEGAITKWRGLRRWKLAAALAFSAVLVNVPYWLTAHTFRFERLGFFTLEYTLVGILAMYVSPIVSASMLVALTFVDLLYGICQTYYLTIGPCFSNLSAIVSFSASRIAAACAMGALMVCVAWASAWLQRHWVAQSDRKLAITLLLGFVIFVQGIDLMEHPADTGIIPNFLHVNLQRDGLNNAEGQLMARNPFVRLLRLEWAVEIKVELMGRKQAALSRKVPNASELGLQGFGTGASSPATQPPDVVLVLLESWGLATDEQLNKAFQATYSQAGVSERYRVEAGHVPFFGGTVAGESRELCRTSAAFHLLSASAEELNSCLADRLKGTGYHTVALHGMDGDMFNRSVWYQTMGFQETLFKDDFEQMGLPDCNGAFRGTCDSSLADWIGRRLESPSQQPLFMYWVTLNSHLPVVTPSGLADAAPCPANLSLGSENLSFGPDTTLCSWYQLVQNVHRNVAKLAMGKLSRPTIFIVVGDHAPPFGNAERRRLFSQTEVPYLVMLPR